jgi:hypothetical protein
MISVGWPFVIVPKITKGYLERGFTAEKGDLETLTNLLGHPPRRYEDFAREVVSTWQSADTRHQAGGNDPNLPEFKSRFRMSVTTPCGMRARLSITELFHRMQKITKN